MKNNQNAGFSLIEVMVAICLLALIVIPVSSGLLLSQRMNAKTEALMQSQMRVSSAVEYLMANGYSDAAEEYAEETYDVMVSAGSESGFWRSIAVSHGEVAVSTCVRVGDGS